MNTIRRASILHSPTTTNICGYWEHVVGGQGGSPCADVRVLHLFWVSNWIFAFEYWKVWLLSCSSMESPLYCHVSGDTCTKIDQLSGHLSPDIQFISPLSICACTYIHMCMILFTHMFLLRYHLISHTSPPFVAKKKRYKLICMYDLASKISWHIISQLLSLN